MCDLLCLQPLLAAALVRLFPYVYDRPAGLSAHGGAMYTCPLGVVFVTQHARSGVRTRPRVCMHAMQHHAAASDGHGRTSQLHAAIDHGALQSCVPYSTDTPPSLRFIQAFKSLQVSRQGARVDVTWLCSSVTNLTVFTKE